ncbi:MAG: DUF2282 domain-containing protein, partial [Bauldia sp.]|nr:DUF2282 domain-containing protein [Bauldia sp.]
MSTAKNLTAAVLAGAVTAAVASFSVPASAEDMVKCYGVSLKGQNDCA